MSAGGRGRPAAGRRDRANDVLFSRPFPNLEQHLQSDETGASLETDGV
jgi:hypothetical protein